MRAPARLRGEALLPLATLIALGAGWGLTQSLSKIAVSAGHRHFGLLLWQTVIGACLLGAALLLRGRPVAVGRAQCVVWLLIALVGTVLPGIAFYQAVAHLPAGVMAVMISLVPMVAFPLALALRIERFAPLRLSGLALGLLGVALLALPDGTLPDRAALAWIPVAMVAPFLYALESVGIARWGTAGLDALEVLFGACVVGALLTLPLAWSTGQMIDPRAPWSAAKWAILAASSVNAAVYVGYVWLVGRAGATFAAQVSYLMTGAGVLWAMALLGERYGWTIWPAIAAIAAGLFLVQSRPPAPRRTV